MWRLMTVLVAVPGVALCMLNVYLGMTPEAHEPPPFVPYEHLRIRNKVCHTFCLIPSLIVEYSLCFLQRFPWGDGQRSFFHNPHVNPLPTGFEHSDDGHH